MESAYDIKALGESIVAEAKKEGLPMAEDAVERLGKAAYNAFKAWVKESAVLSKGGVLAQVDDYLAPFIDQLDPVVVPQIEKIDLDGSGS